MKLLVLAPSLQNTSPGSRFRIEQWTRFWQEHGVQSHYAAFEDEALHSIIYQPGRFGRKAALMLRAVARRALLLRNVREYDAVFIYEEASRVGPAIMERAIKALGVPIVYDFCDPIHLPYRSASNSFFNRLKFPGKTRTICRLSKRVLVGNEELAKFARHRSVSVTIVPITIDTDEYAPAAAAQNPIPVIGWTGSHSTLPHLLQAEKVLRDLGQARRFELRVLGAKHLVISGVATTSEEWHAEREIPFLHSCDIGIMPLPDDPWTRQRTHLKVRQFMAVGVPCVASPSGVIRELIQDGVNGFLASTGSEWKRKLIALLDDPILRARMGACARRTIVEKYSANLWAPRVLEVLRDAVGANGVNR